MQMSKIIFSDTTERGEGEHKILQYIKKNNIQKSVIYGLDADLIMLSIVSNKENIYLLRERTEYNIEDTDNDYIYLNIDKLKELITSKTKIVAVTHLSNVTGTIVPIKEIVEIAHKKNVPVLVDGCQSVPHIKVDVTDLDCDFYAFSAHKVYGPTGVGILYAKKKWLEKLPPYIGGGAMISEVKKDKIIYAPLPEKYEAGTMPTAEVITFNESIKFMQSISNKIINNIRGINRVVYDITSKPPSTIELE